MVSIRNGAAAALVCLSACSGGSGGTSGGFRLIEFLESGQNNIPRNRQVKFRFSAPVMENQDFSSRLRIQNVIQDAPANFSRARGFYLVNGEEVASLPRADLDVEGVVGIRVNHALNLHVSKLEVTPGT